MMSHIVAQLNPSKSRPNSDGAISGSKKSPELRRKNGKPFPSIHLDIHSPSVTNHTGTPETYSPSITRGPKTPKFNLLLTPKSAVSAIFDSPFKSSPSSSISSTQSVAIVKKDSAPLAELEDTSPAYKYSELEDTSEIAIRSSKKLTMAPTRSTHPTNQALVLAVDQQFAQYEAKIRDLQNQLAATEHLLTNAKTSVAEAKGALEQARDTIADQGYEISHKNQQILNLEKEVEHCLRHHLPPPTPSKSRGLDVALSRFNPESSPMSTSVIASSPHLAISPSLTGSPSAVTSKVHGETCLSASISPSPRSVTVAASSISASLSAAGSPGHEYYNRGAVVPRPANYTLLTAKALSDAFGPENAASNSFTNTNWRSTIGHVKYDHEQPFRTHGEDTRTTSKPGISRRQLYSPKSSPNLVQHPNPKYQKHFSDLPPIMNGGLGISGFTVSEMQERKIRKERGGMGELLRNRDQDPKDSMGDSWH